MVRAYIRVRMKDAIYSSLRDIVFASFPLPSLKIGDFQLRLFRVDENPRGVYGFVYCHFFQFICKFIPNRLLEVNKSVIYSESSADTGVKCKYSLLPSTRSYNLRVKVKLT